MADLWSGSPSATKVNFLSDAERNQKDVSIVPPMNTLWSILGYGVGQGWEMAKAFGNVVTHTAGTLWDLIKNTKEQSSAVDDAINY